MPLICNAMQAPWVPIINATVNNNTGKPVTLSIEINDPDNRLNPQKTAQIITKIVKAYSKESFRIETERK